MKNIGMVQLKNLLHLKLIIIRKLIELGMQSKTNVNEGLIYKLYIAYLMNRDKYLAHSFVFPLGNSTEVITKFSGCIKTPVPKPVHFLKRFT